MLATIIVLSLTALGVILFGVKQFKLSSQFASVNQVANISHILVRQQANLFSVLLTNNAKTEQLTDNLDQIVKEDFILDASLYDGEGKIKPYKEVAATAKGRLDDISKTISEAQRGVKNAEAQLKEVTEKRDAAVASENKALQNSQARQLSLR